MKSVPWTPSRSRSAEPRPSAVTISSGVGQSVRCTLRPPVRPRQISSETSGASGAMTRVSTSSAVQSVSKAVWSSSQNRWRCVRTYQFVSTSRCWRTASHAPEMSYSSRSAVTRVTSSRVRASRSRSAVASERAPPSSTRRARRPAPSFAAPA